MKNFNGIILSSSKELKNVKNLVLASILMALGFILHFFTVPITPFMRISLGFIVQAMIGMLFGPVVGAMCGGMSDIINYLSTPNGPYFPGFTISGILAGILYGAALYNKRLTVLRCAIVTLIVTGVIDIILNTYWLYLLYGKAFFALLPLRATTNLIQIPIKVAMIYFILNLINRVKR